MTAYLIGAFFLLMAAFCLEVGLRCYKDGKVLLGALCGYGGLAWAFSAAKWVAIGTGAN